MDIESIGDDSFYELCSLNDIANYITADEKQEKSSGQMLAQILRKGDVL